MLNELIHPFEDNSSFDDYFPDDLAKAEYERHKQVLEGVAQTLIVRAPADPKEADRPLLAPAAKAEYPAG
jgi:hypothetical protein